MVTLFIRISEEIIVRSTLRMVWMESDRSEKLKPVMVERKRVVSVDASEEM